jgi:dTDP-glucose 4,6-dehydratase
MIFVTGGCGFIGSNFVLGWISSTAEPVLIIDKLTYASNPQNLAKLPKERAPEIVKCDIGDHQQVADLLARHQPRAVLNFAAESHVDRSILGPGEFIQSNIVGTFQLLEATKQYWNSLSAEAQGEFRFLHVSTDEVYGSLSLNDTAFDENSPHRPNSPYSASKAASDHLVRAWHHTYGLPILTTNCSNNYGPYHFPEKLIPLIITNALAGKSLPIYGDGLQIRDWLYVDDHCRAIASVLKNGLAGETYNIGGHNEKTNIEIVRAICALLDELCPKPDGTSYQTQISFVKDRPGHDRRYAVNATKISADLGWSPIETFETGIRKTVNWYLENPDWIENIKTGSYREWMAKQYG